MNKIKTERNNTINEEVKSTVLENGLRVYIYPRKGYTKKMGMLGTVFGSIDNEIIYENNKVTKLPDGIAHFLEHKLFEQEGANALDIFSKMGVDTNAYTTFDHTVYYFETADKYEESLEELIEFVSSPYFTDKNVEKEKGIIGQEIKMYEDEPNAVVYYNLLKCLYKTHPVNIDIAGTIETITPITKEILYECYNAYYSLSNMFLLIIGDVNVDETIEEVKRLTKIYKNNKNIKIIKKEFIEQEEIVKKEINKKLEVAVPMECIGFKLNPYKGQKKIKGEIIAEIINDACFSKSSDFYERLYEMGIVSSEPDFSFEGGNGYSYLLISSYIIKVEEYEKEIIEYLEKLKKEGIKEEDFNRVINKKIGDVIYSSERMNWVYRSIIDGILNDTEVFKPIQILKEITKEDINDFLKETIVFEKMAISRILPRDK
ncbi:MAG: pitrilysin family protein [Clostridia bacterium]|nr:pitrilysin family protein [Clostridia bacterium]MDD4375291.1 pitrilysin family protein [Clostridia bacterium]